MFWVILRAHQLSMNFLQLTPVKGLAQSTTWSCHVFMSEMNLITQLSTFIVHECSRFSRMPVTLKTRPWVFSRATDPWVVGIVSGGNSFWSVEVTSQSSKEQTWRQKYEEGLNLRRGAKGGRWEDWMWSVATLNWVWKVFFSWGQKRWQKGEVEVIDLFVQRAEDCRDTTVGAMSEIESRG